MLTNYHDILSRIVEPPRWFDEHGVPRWYDFHPMYCANIYADEVALIEIRCQGCGRPFNVCVSSGILDFRHNNSLSQLLKAGELTYGDPPNIHCCASGPTMNSIPIRILEFWHMPKAIGSTWQRRPRLERKINCSWWTEDDERDHGR